MLAEKKNKRASTLIQCLQYFTVGKYFFVLATKKEPQSQESSPGIVPPGEETPQEDFKIEIPTKKAHSRVYVIHTGEGPMEKDVISLLKKIDLQPLLRHNRLDSIKSLEQEFADQTNANFAVVILSSDEFVYSKNGKPGDAKLRARQDIIFDLGYLLGRLGRQNVLALYYEQKSFLLPTLLHNAVYLPYDKGGGWQQALMKRLQFCGYNIKDGAP